MKEVFEQELSGILFGFERVFYNHQDLYYHVRFDNDGKKETFRMKRDEEGMWKILAQVLPISIHELEFELNDLIEENESKA